MLYVLFEPMHSRISTMWSFEAFLFNTLPEIFASLGDERDENVPVLHEMKVVIWSICHGFLPSVMHFVGKVIIQICYKILDKIFCLTHFHCQTVLMKNSNIAMLLVPCSLPNLIMVDFDSCDSIYTNYGLGKQVGISNFFFVASNFKFVEKTCYVNGRN